MQKRSHFIEIACFNKESAIIAAKAGADRLELCSHRELGGISPDLQWVKEVKEEVNIPVYLMIRPRGVNFIYTEHEITELVNYMEAAHHISVDGFVFGCLKIGNQLDMNQNERLIKAANHKPCTLHKAFDEVIDPFETLEQAIALGFKNILSSGCKTEASQGISLLSKLCMEGLGKINIMPGGNIRSTNLEHIKKFTGAMWYHSAAIIGNIETPDSSEIKALLKQ